MAEAAVLWFNLEQGHSFELTGLVDYESALTADPTEAYELGLILCDGEICARQQVGVQPGEKIIYPVHVSRDRLMVAGRVQTGSSTR